MYRVLLVVALVALASAARVHDSVYQAKFADFQKQFNKVYTADEIDERFAAFKENVDKIEKINANPDNTFTAGLNEFSDLTSKEFRARFMPNLRTDEHTHENGETHVHRSMFEHHSAVVKPDTEKHISFPPAAPSVDWRTKGVVTPVKNQGQCGSNWAFSVTGTIEALHAIKTKRLISLSEQQLVDCSGPQGNSGCCGGLMTYAYQYIIANGGIDSEQDYPYTANVTACDAQKTAHHVVKINGYRNLTPKNETLLAEAVNQQPIAVALDFDSEDIIYYTGGIYNGNCGISPSHALLLVGYGTEGNQDYWILKNDFGTTWGEQGYIYVAKSGGAGSPGKCGITLMSSYPTL